MLVSAVQERYKQRRVPDAVLDRHSRRLLPHDGPTHQIGVAVPLLPPKNHIPENHLLRLIDRHVSFDFVREKLRDSYSDTGRPSIGPEILLRILLLGYLYGITSERKLVEELRMHLAWCWFTGLGFEQEIPHHSTFSKNRHGRFQESTTRRRSVAADARRRTSVRAGSTAVLPSTPVKLHDSEHVVPRHNSVRL